MPELSSLEGVEVHKVAVLSTVHLRPRTAEVMEAEGTMGFRDFPFIVAPFHEGFFVSCASVPDACDDAHESLWACRHWAKERGVRYLMFDRDADTVEGLQTYEEEWD